MYIRITKRLHANISLKLKKEPLKAPAHEVYYIVDEELFQKWQQATGVRLTKFPRRKDNSRTTTTATQQKKARKQVEVRHVSTPPKDRPIVGYKRAAMAISNSQATDKSVSSILVTDKRAKPSAETLYPKGRQTLEKS